METSKAMGLSNLWREGDLGIHVRQVHRPHGSKGQGFEGDGVGPAGCWVRHLLFLFPPGLQLPELPPNTLARCRNVPQGTKSPSFPVSSPIPIDQAHCLVDYLVAE
jgi:hypothetical protein